MATNISGSGHVDLACANSDNGYPGSVTIFLNDGHGNFTSNNIVMLGTGSVENYPDGLAAADFNGDGKMDLVVANFGTASLTVLTQEGSGRPTNGQPPSVSITNPTNGASFLTTQGFAIEATATSAKGISAIVYFLDGNPVGTNTTAPYNFQVTPNSLPAGGHNLEVTAADSAGLVSTSAVVHITVNGAGTSLIDFDALDASAGDVGGATLANYLAGYGVTVADVTGGAVMEAVDTNSFTGNLQVLAPSSPNVFTETGVSGPLSFTLRFAAPLQSFGFTRAGLIPQTGLATHPQWTATALSADGTELSSVSEALIISQREVPARSLSLIGIGSPPFVSIPTASRPRHSRRSCSTTWS